MHWHESATASDESTRQLLVRAHEIGPILARSAGAAERSGRLSEEAYSALRQAGFLKLWRPASLGGLEVSPLAHALVTEEVATFDSAAAWTMMAASNAAFDLRMARPAFVQHVYSEDGDALVCATLNKPLVAEQSRDGYVVTGEVPFASGCHYARWLGHLCLPQRAGEPVLNDAGNPRLLLVYHPRESVQIVDDWDSLGLRGTSSNSIRLEAAFVPEERTVDLGAVSPASGHFSGPLYRCPIALLSSTTFAPALGVLRGALGALTEAAETKVPFATSAPLKQRSLAQLHYARALGHYRAARSYLHAELERAFQAAREGAKFTLQDKAALILAATHGSQACVEAVRELAAAAGTTAIYRRSPLERALRDIETLKHHALLAEGRYANVAQAEWDAPIDFPLMTLD